MEHRLALSFRMVPSVFRWVVEAIYERCCADRRHCPGGSGGASNVLKQDRRRYHKRQGRGYVWTKI